MPPRPRAHDPDDGARRERCGGDTRDTSERECDPPSRRQANIAGRPPEIGWRGMSGNVSRRQVGDGAAVACAGDAFWTRRRGLGQRLSSSGPESGRRRRSRRLLRSLHGAARRLREGNGASDLLDPRRAYRGKGRRSRRRDSTRVTSRTVPRVDCSRRARDLREPFVETSTTPTRSSMLPTRRAYGSPSTTNTARSRFFAA